jgi:hypothetical protein
MLEASRGNNEASLEYATRLVDLDPKKGESHILQGQAQGALDNRSAMLGDLLIGQALESGMEISPSEAPVQAEKFGTTSDLKAQYRESGEPEEIRTYSDNTGSQYQIWFYWSRGEAYCYQDGKEIHAKKFRRVEEAEETPEGEEDAEVSPGGE